jgi:chemotaxis protein MotB
MAEVGGGRRARSGLNAWPGYVDALSTLLLVVIFVLMVFVLAQGFLAVALSSRDQALDRLHRQVAELGEMLALERGRTEELRGSLGRTAEELRAAAAAREALARQLAGLREERDRIGAERDTVRAERDRLAARLADLDLAARGASQRVATLEQRLAEALARAEASGGDAARRLRDLNEARRGLALEREAREATERERAALGEQLAATRRDLAAMRREAEALDRQVRVEREMVEARLSDIARLSQQVQALAALRDELERQAQAALARAEEEARRRRAAEAQAMQAGEQASEAERRRREAETAAARANSLAAEADRLRRLAAGEAAAATARAEEAERRRLAAETRQAEALRLASAEEERRRAAEMRAEADARAREAAQARAAEQTRLAESAQAQLALLNRQIEALRAELARLNAALQASEAAEAEKDAQIANLGARLNAALAARIEELQQYRSDFFGRLRRILGDRPEVRVVGDRFVFQSEVLFPPGSADLSAAGERSVRELAGVLIEIARQIPPDIAWILRVDGHADRTPIRTARFASNWELSAARAIAVAQLLIQEGLPPNRVAATAFGDTQPLDPGDTPEAYARNRRIELRLTDR